MENEKTNQRFFIIELTDDEENAKADKTDSFDLNFKRKSLKQQSSTYRKFSSKSIKGIVLNEFCTQVYSIKKKKYVNFENYWRRFCNLIINKNKHSESSFQEIFEFRYNPIKNLSDSDTNYFKESESPRSVKYTNGYSSQKVKKIRLSISPLKNHEKLNITGNQDNLGVDKNFNGSKKKISIPYKRTFSMNLYKKTRFSEDKNEKELSQIWNNQILKNLKDFGIDKFKEKLFKEFEPKKFILSRELATELTIDRSYCNKVCSICKTNEVK